MELTKEVMQALYLGDEDIKEFQDIERERIKDTDAVTKAIIEIAEAYDEQHGAGAYEKLEMWKKLVILWQGAAFGGYCRALQEVKEAQDYGLTGELPSE